MPGTVVVEVEAVASNILEAAGGNVATAVGMQGLNDATQPMKTPVGASEIKGRFFGFQLSGENTNSIIRYLGAILRGRRVV
jgi:hypothetical protein